MTEPSPRTIWTTIRDAIRGSEEDLTKVSIRHAVALLAIPTVLEMSMESLFAVIDIFYVSKLGSDAIATVGLTESLLSPVYALAMGLGAGATAIISRRTGEKDADGAAQAAVQAIAVAIGAAAVLGIAGVFLAPTFLSLMGASPSMLASGTGYTRLMLGGSVTIFLLFVVNAVFRSAGDAAIAMRVLWLSNILNIVLAPCFIFGIGPIPRMGVAGAAFATTVSRGIGVAYQFFVLARRSRRIEIARRHLVANGRTMLEVFRIGAPATFQVLIETASWLALVRIIASHGSVAVAGYTIAMRIVIFALLPSWGLATAAATLVGQNLGAGEPERAKRSVVTIAKYSVAFLGPVSLLFALAPGALVGLFSSDAQTAAYGVDCLRIVSLGFVVFAFGMVAVQAFNGAGDTTTPMIVNLGSFWFFKIPLAWFLAEIMHMGPHGAFLAITAAYTLQGVTAGALFRRGKWQTRKV